MAENMFCKGQRTTSDEYRNNWDDIFGKASEKAAIKTWAKWKEELVVDDLDREFNMKH